MFRFDSVPAWSIGSKPKISAIKGKHPGPGTYENVGYDTRPAPKVSIPKSKRGAGTQGETFDVGPGQYYTGYSSLTRGGVSLKGGKLVSHGA